MSRRLLQITVAVLCLVPLGAGFAGVMLGPRLVGGMAEGARDLDSHFRYLSGLLLGLGLVFASAVPAIERRVARFRLAALVVVCGGFGRLVALPMSGMPGAVHVAALVMELGVVPLLVVWQAQVARAAAAPSGRLPPSGRPPDLERLPDALEGRDQPVHRRIVVQRARA